MATIIRIKRHLDEEPTENIVIRSKRFRRENSDDAVCDTSCDKPSTVLMRVGTVQSKEEPVEPLVIKAVKKGFQLKDQYKKLGSETGYKNNARLEAKKRAIRKRYKIITQSRGIGEVQSSDGKLACAAIGEKKTDAENEEGAEALPSSSTEFTYFDAVLANEVDNIITCNGVPMEAENYVYDVFYSSLPVDWTEVMEKNMCEIEKEVYEDVNNSDSDELFEDDDDENDESNWRNDYPDYDDSPYEDEEDYLNVQIKKCNLKTYDTDESYDLEDYDDEAFDVDGNLIQSNNPSLITNLLKKTHLEESDSEDDS